MGDRRRSARPGSEVASDPASEPSVALDERSREVLDFEREAWKLTVPKQRAIRERFGFSPSRYHQLLHRIIDRPEAVAYDPMLVRRLRRVRAVRRRFRTAQGLGVRV
ncbi:MAG TPA: DUF3263 domain-containing protein [Actinomycetota bacterium]